MNVVKKRMDYADMAKGIGIILVVAGHSTFASDTLLTWLVSFHMPLFFVISGMLLQYTGEEKKPKKEILLRKLKSIMLPYLTFSILILAVKLLYLIRTPELMTAADLQKALLETVSLYGISVMWFLPALFFGELVFLAVRKKCSHTITIGIGMVLAVVAVGGRPIVEGLVTGDGGVVYAALCFLKMLLRASSAYVFLLLGYYTKKLLKEKEGIRYTELLLAVVCFGVNVAAAFSNIRVDLNFLVFGNPVLYFVSAYAGSMGVVLLCRNLPRFRPLTFCGVNSLIIMATHLECQILMLAIRVSAPLSLYFGPLQKPALYLLLAVSITAMEVVTIYVFNHYLYVLIGKKKPKEKYS